MDLSNNQYKLDSDDAIYLIDGKVCSIRTLVDNGHIIVSFETKTNNDLIEIILPESLSEQINLNGIYIIHNLFRRRDSLIWSNQSSIYNYEK